MQRQGAIYKALLALLLVSTSLFLLYRYSRRMNGKNFVQKIQEGNKPRLDSLQNEINKENALYSQLQKSINDGDFQTALPLIDTLFSQNKRDIAHVYMGMYYEKQSDFEKAIEHYNRAIEINEFSIAMSRRAEAYIKLNKFDLALQDYKKIYEVRRERGKWNLFCECL